MGPVPAEEAGNYREDKSQTLFFFNLQYLSSLWLGLELESLGSWPTGMLRIFFHCPLGWLLIVIDFFYYSLTGFGVLSCACLQCRGSWLCGMGP